MGDPEFWARVRQQRDAQHPPSPRDRVLWVLMKAGQRAEAVVRVIDGTGIDLRYLHNGELRASQLYRDDAQAAGHGGGEAQRPVGEGWIDPGSLSWGR